jgi:hypothetical protein
MDPLPLDEALAETMQRIRQRAPREEPTYRCICNDTGFILVDPTGHGAYRPCERCRPDEHRRWKNGHYAPNHDCPQCRALRERPRGRRRVEPYEEPYE